MNKNPKYIVSIITIFFLFLWTGYPIIKGLISVNFEIGGLMIIGLLWVGFCSLCLAICIQRYLGIDTLYKHIKIPLAIFSVVILSMSAYAYMIR